QLLTNLIVPSGHNGQIMYSYVMNDILTAGGFTDPSRTNAPFQPIKINKTNNLSLNRVYFLVTSSSASASELVINALKPYMDVQIISTQGRGTYGKPVGSFGRAVMSNAARLYITSFKMTNAA
ncbi:S41 family peptidase, partial [Brucella sp. 21LCYQ03]|nr:S41 family peptidase [Brucella sp. 21LCYQ03]